MRKINTGTNSIPFGKILAGLVEERGLTLRQAAELAGVSPSVVQNWLEGKNPHDLRAVARLAQGLGVGFKSLLLGETEGRSVPATVAEIFEERKLLDGLCRVSITRLVPRDGKSE